MEAKFIFSLLLFIATSAELTAQDKQEQEMRIEEGAAPETARTWLAAVFGDINRVRWYAEETSGRRSVEAKFKHQRRHYSVEFSTTGELEDVELERKLRQLPDSIRQQLVQTFQTLPKFHLHRLQEQWQGSTAGIKAALRGEFLPNEVVVQYEIEFTAELDKTYRLWEGTLNTEGQLLEGFSLWL
jgi:hypothetical protein